MATSKKKNSTSSNSSSYAQLLGQMYRCFVLDCINDCGYAVSQDFSLRPDLYQELMPENAALISKLQSSIDSEPSLPGADTRAMLYKPIFGSSDANGSGNDGSAYQKSRLHLITGAVNYAHLTVEAGRPSLRDRVRSALIPLRDHFRGLEGSSITQTSFRTKEIFDISTKIITDDGVRVVFGISKPVNSLESSDPQAAKLIEKISEQLQENIPSGSISRERFNQLRSIAELGDVAIQAILGSSSEDNDEDLNDLIKKLYAWGSELGLAG